MSHERMKPRTVEPDAEARAYHRWLIEHVQNCEACGYFGRLATHHILPRSARDHWKVVRICHPCHNGRTDSVHLLGSEAKFFEHHNVDLVAISIARLKEYRNECDRPR